MDSQILFRAQQEDSLKALTYSLPVSRQPSTIDVLEIVYHDSAGSTECRVADVKEEDLVKWLDLAPSGTSVSPSSSGQRRSIFILGPSPGHFGYHSKKFPGLDSYPSHSLPISPDVYKEVEEAFQLPAATAWSLVSDSTHFQKYSVDLRNPDEEGLGFTMRLASDGIIDIDLCVSISYHPGSGTVRAFLHGCSSKQQVMVRGRLVQYSAVSDHPLLLPTILVEMKMDRLDQEQSEVWNLLVKVETQSKQTGAPGIKMYTGNFEHLKIDDELEVDRKEQRQVDAAFEQMALTVIGIIQRTTYLVSHVNTILLSNREIQDNMQIVNDIASSSRAAHLKKAGTMLSEKLRLLEHRAQVMAGNIEFVEKRAQSQLSAIYNFRAMQDARLQRDLAETSRQISQAAKRDSSAMKGIAVLTMVFLPGTYIATFFAMPILDFTTDSRLPSVNHAFWLYWSITAPLTVLVLIIYTLFVIYVNQKYKKKYRTELVNRVGL